MLQPLFYTALFMTGLLLIVKDVFQINLFGRRSSAERERLASILSASNPEAFAEARAEKRHREAKGRAPILEAVASRIEGSQYVRVGQGRDIIAWLDRELTVAGMRAQYTPYQALALAIVVWAIAAVVPTALFIVGALPKILYPVLTFVLVAFPPMQLNSRKRIRKEKIKTEVPWVIHELAMALATEAMTIDDAIARVSRARETDVKRSPLQEELAQAFKEYFNGIHDRETALRGVAQRTEVLQVETFMDTLINALRTGAPIVAVLDEYAEAATEDWKQDMRGFINKKQTTFTFSLLCVAFGIAILYATPLFISAFAGFGSAS